jgi:hypothetical protein
MGMFDSFYIKIDGKEQEIQTKQLDRCLEHWTLGDSVDINNGSMVIVETTHLEKPQFAAMVIFMGIFVDYAVGDIAEEVHEEGHKILSKYSHTDNPINKVIELLHESNKEKDVLNRKINSSFGGVPIIKDYLNGDDKVFKKIKRAFFDKVHFKASIEDRLKMVTKEQQLYFLLNHLIDNILDNFPNYKPYNPDYKYTPDFKDLKKES